MSKHTLWKRFRHLLNGKKDDNIRNTIEELIQKSNEIVPSIELDEKELLGNVLGLRDLTVSDVMVPRNDIVAVSTAVTLNELVTCFLQTNVSRIVVFEKNLDDLIGFVHIKDVLAWTQSKKPFRIKNILRELIFIAPSMRTLDLLLQMRASALKLAIVVDEYGGVDGLVTFSNLVEEVVGDVEGMGEENDGTVPLEIRADGTAIADARTRVEDFEEVTNIKLPLSSFERKIDTLGGLVYFSIGRIPSPGELIPHASGLEFEVIEADLRRLKKLKIHNITTAKTENIYQD